MEDHGCLDHDYDFNKPSTITTNQSPPPSSFIDGQNDGFRVYEMWFLSESVCFNALFSVLL